MHGSERHGYTDLLGHTPLLCMPWTRWNNDRSIQSLETKDGGMERPTFLIVYIKLKKKNVSLRAEL